MVDRSSHVDPHAVELFVAFLDRVQAGERLDFEAFCRDHAEHAAALRSLKEPWDAANACLERVQATGPLTQRLLQRFTAEPAEPRAPRPAGAAHGSDESALLARLRRDGPRDARYRKLEDVAHGGMGVIWKVWDDELRRSIAMKLLIEDSPTSTGEPSSSSARTIGRFLEEAQVTGQLDHPGIVPVHELGLSSDGRVYFTMRLVKGVDLRAVFGWVREGREGWTPTRALGVLLRVCEALGYAHAKGVIHRDLKPANVMVGKFGEVYVMDWGLARVLGQPDRHDLRLRTPPSVSVVITDRRERRDETPDSPLVTMDGDVVGTPSYMAPEQARGELERLGPRSDVYSLGAMLYQLLAGEAPYTSHGARASPRTILARAIAGPPTPLEVLAPATPAELVAICERAMAREPERRYGGMAELAEDLRAYLEHRVVAAYETGAWAEARKWVRRNRALAAALAAAVLILVAGLGASTTQYVRAEDNYAIARDREREAAANADRALREAERANAEAVAAAEQRRRAEDLRVQAEAARAESEARAHELGEVARFQASMLGSVDPESLGVRLRADVLREVRAALERSQADDSEIEARAQQASSLLAGVNFTNAAVASLEHGVLDPALAAIEEDFGDQPHVRAQLLRSAGAALRGLGRPESAHAALAESYEVCRQDLGADHEHTLAGANELAIAWMERGRPDEAEALLRDALERATRNLGLDHDVTISITNDLALALKRRGRYEEAEPLYLDALERRRRIQGEDDPETIEVMHNLASLLEVRDRSNEAEAMFRDVLERRRRILGADHAETLTTVNNLAGVLETMGKLDEAEALYRDNLARRERTLGSEHPRTLSSMSNLGRFLRLRGDLDEAERLLRGALDVRRRVLGDGHADTLTSMSNFASLLRTQGKLAEAETCYRAALEGRRKLLGDEDPSTLTAQVNLGLLLKDRGRFEEAEGLMRSAIAASRRLLGDDHSDTITSLGNLASILRARGKPEEAEPLQREVVERRRALFGAENPRTLASMTSLATTLADLARFDEAEALYREVLAVRTRILGADDKSTLAALNNVGAVLSLQGKFAESEPVLRDAVERSRRALGDDHVDTLAAVEDLALALSHLRRGDEAEALYRDAVERGRRKHGDAHPAVDSLEFELAVQLKDNGNAAEAEGLLRRCVERRRGRDDTDRGLLDALCGLGGVLVTLRKLDEAEPLLLDCERRCQLIGQRAQPALTATYKRMVALYDAREADEPGRGWAAKAARYRALVGPRGE